VESEEFEGATVTAFQHKLDITERVQSLLKSSNNLVWKKSAPASSKFSCLCVSREVLDQLADFLLQDDVSRPSSCRSVVIDGEECPVRYWQDSIKQMVKQYLLEFPNDMKRSYIYVHVPKNFRSNTC